MIADEAIAKRMKQQTNGYDAKEVVKQIQVEEELWSDPKSKKNAAKQAKQLKDQQRATEREKRKVIDSMNKKLRLKNKEL